MRRYENNVFTVADSACEPLPAEYKYCEEWRWQEISDPFAEYFTCTEFICCERPCEHFEGYATATLYPTVDEYCDVNGEYPGEVCLTSDQVEWFGDTQSCTDPVLSCLAQEDADALDTGA